MNRKNPIFWLRLSYWTGAIIDFLATLQILSPAIFALTNKLSDFHPTMEYRYAMGMGASLMLGWTVILIWADRKPLERKGILLITVFPVIFGMVINEIGGVWSGLITMGTMIPIWILQIILVMFFGFSHMDAQKKGAMRHE